jgi:hypothetical protein
MEYIEPIILTEEEVEDFCRILGLYEA